MRLSYGREIKPIISYKKNKQQLTVKSTTMEAFIGYSGERKNKFLDNTILLARNSSSDSDTLYLQKALKVPVLGKLK
jgi:hypothetical protein